MATLRKSISRGHTYWQIVESRRVNGKPRPIVLEHLGTAEALLRRLQEGGQGPVKAKSIRFGAEAALWNMAIELDVVGTIDRHVPKRDQGLSCGQYMLLAAINRCVAASSKASLYRWYHKTVLQRLIPTSRRSLASQRFWDQMCYLDEEKIAAIESEIAIRLVREFKVDLRTLLFDATNFDTFIKTQTVMLLAERGHSKSKRSDLRVVGLALMVSADFNIPLFSHVYPGNQNDSTTFGEVADRLAERYRQVAEGTQEITIVFDGGNTSEENMQRVDLMEYHFITSLTVTHHKDLLAVPLDKFESFEEKRLEGTLAYRTAKEVWGKKRTIVVTHSENLMVGQVAGIEHALRKKRAALHELRAKLRRSQEPDARGKGYTAESLQKQLKDITKGQYVSEILKTEVTQSKDGLDFSFHTDQAAYQRLMNTRLGKRILCTDNDQWTTREIILGSRAQFHVENAFKQMKDPHWVRFSPAFHWTDQKLRVHAFYCILALTLAGLLQRKAAQAGVDMTIPTLFENLSEIREIINLYPPSGASTRGRFRAEYLIEETTPIQEKLCQIFDLKKISRSKNP
jgi:transposase